MDYAAAVATLGVIAVAVYLGGAYVLHRVVRRQDRAIAELRAVVAREGERIDAANIEAGVMATRAGLCAERAEKAAKHAQRASDRSAIASEAAAQRAAEAGDRAAEAGLWARLAGASGERCVPCPRSPRRDR